MSTRTKAAFVAKLKYLMKLKLINQLLLHCHEYFQSHIAAYYLTVRLDIFVKLKYTLYLLLFMQSEKYITPYSGGGGADLNRNRLKRKVA
jgi:hypothetical protein